MKYSRLATFSPVSCLQGHGGMVRAQGFSGERSLQPGLQASFILRRTESTTEYHRQENLNTQLRTAQGFGGISDDSDAPHREADTPYTEKPPIARKPYLTNQMPKLCNANPAHWPDVRSMCCCGSSTSFYKKALSLSLPLSLSLSLSLLLHRFLRRRVLSSDRWRPPSTPSSWTRTRPWPRIWCLEEKRASGVSG